MANDRRYPKAVIISVVGARTLLSVVLLSNQDDDALVAIASSQSKSRVHHRGTEGGTLSTEMLSVRDSANVSGAYRWRGASSDHRFLNTSIRRARI